MKFFTADTHFHHKNLIEKFKNRQLFSTIEEHDKVLIDNWNKKVTNKDSVYVIGDFCFKVRGKELEEFIQKLNGTIYLIPGDHDKGIHRIKDKLIVTDRVEEVGNFILCHHPFLRWAKSHYGSFHLYGHIHQHKVEQIGKAMNVGVDVCNYSPLSEEEVNERMKLLPDNPNLIKKSLDILNSADFYCI